MILPSTGGIQGCASAACRIRPRGFRAISCAALTLEDVVKSADPFYKSRRWIVLRNAVLRRDGYLCRESYRYGKRAEACAVHHIFPRDEFPEYQWEPWNLISLSAEVHDQMHDRATGALTAKGAELLRRTARKMGVEVPGRYRA